MVCSSPTSLGRKCHPQTLNIKGRFISPMWLCIRSSGHILDVDLQVKLGCFCISQQHTAHPCNVWSMILTPNIDWVLGKQLWTSFFIPLLLHKYFFAESHKLKQSNHSQQSLCTSNLDTSPVVQAPFTTCIVSIL